MPPFQLPPVYDLAVGENFILATPSNASGPVYAFSAQRGDWSTLTGAGQYVSSPGAAA